jgi:alcohol dehydrogenase class IV
VSERRFTYDALAGRVVFGAGSRHTIADEIDALGATRILVIASNHEATIADGISAVLGERVVGRFNDVVQHVPVAKAAAAVAAAKDLGADGLVAIGGGSAIGLAKAVRLELDVAFLAVPTTYAGSEMTTIWGRSDGRHKETGKDPRVKPDTVVYDVELTLSLPARIAGPSGMNALAHCVEALYGPGANPVTDLLALEGIRALAASLPTVCGADDPDARSELQYGAYLAGIALASGGTALHHKTCHVLGGMFDLDHGDMNAVVLGHALAYNAPAIPEQMQRIGDALGTSSDDAPGAVWELARSIGAPTSLDALGMPTDGIDEATRRIVVEAAANVRPPQATSIHQMLDDAFHGRKPT